MEIDRSDLFQEFDIKLGTVPSLMIGLPSRISQNCLVLVRSGPKFLRMSSPGDKAMGFQLCQQSDQFLVIPFK